MTPASALSIADATREYVVNVRGKRRTLRALRGIDLEIREGEVVAIVGESGCGKTTLSRLMLGIEAPTQGSVTLAGKPISAYHRIERAGLIQPVFQDPYSSLNPRQTLGAIIAAPLAVRGEGSARSRQDAAIAMMQSVGLPAHLIHAYPSQISGGQRQRVAIARALIAHPRILICDEPTSALDVSIQAQVLNLLMDLQRDMGVAYVFISHNLAVVEHIADEVVVMYLGRIVEQGTVREVFDSARHPYTRALLAATPRLDPAERTLREPVRGEPPSPLSPPPGCPYASRCAHAQPRCREELPLLREVAAHRVACHFAETIG